jgi:hypothetical protein
LYPAFLVAGIGLAGIMLWGGVFPRTGNLIGLGLAGNGTAPGSGLAAIRGIGPMNGRPFAASAPEVSDGAAARDAVSGTKRPFTIRPIVAEAGIRCGRPAAVPVTCRGSPGWLVMTIVTAEISPMMRANAVLTAPIRRTRMETPIDSHHM